MKNVVVLKQISGAPTEFQILPFGRIDIEKDDPVILDDHSMDNIIKEFESRGNDMVIDYEHQTLNDVQAPAAGWIKKLLKRGSQGLWAVVEWTEKAKEYIANREYRYFSPVMLTRKNDHKVVKLINVALTNSPKINNLRPLIAKMEFTTIDSLQREINKLFGIIDEDFQKYSPRPPAPGHEENDVQRRINKLMGISDEDFLLYSPQTPAPRHEGNDEEKIQRLLGLK